jgi:hypothetical protein
MKTTKRGVRITTVPEPSIKEELDDELPF